MGMVVDSYRFAAGAPPAFDPIADVAWSSAYWVEGTEFAALSYTNGDPVDTWPDEVAAIDLTATTTNRPTYESARTQLNSKPALGLNTDFINSATFTLVASPWTVVVVGDGIQSGGIMWARSGGIWLFYNTAGQWRTQAGINGGTSDTGKHLFVFVCNGASSKLIVDGTTIATGSTTATVNNYGIGSLAVGSFPITAGGAAFFGFAASDLSSGSSLTDLLSWSQTYYGTP